MAYVRTVKTASGAIAVQIVHGSRGGSREIEHIGSAHTPAEVEVLKTVARQRLHANQDALDFDDGQLDHAEAPIVASRARHLWETLTAAYRAVGFDRACPDEVFFQLVLARVVEPTSKLDSIRVLDDLGGRCRLVSDDQATAAGLCHRSVAPAAGRSVRHACRARPGHPGPLRRHHLVLRDR